MNEKGMIENPLRGDIIPRGSVQLKAEDLLSKHGFEDGEILDDMLEDAGFDPVASLGTGDDGWEILLGAEVLELIVRRKFGDTLPEGVIQGRQSLAHNPVRLAPELEMRVTKARLVGLRAWVSPEEVSSAAREIITAGSALAQRF